MMKLVFLTCFILAVFAEEDPRMVEINKLRTLRRIQGIQHHGMAHLLQSHRQKKDQASTGLKCNACTFAIGAYGCAYRSETCTSTEICVDVWRDAGNPRNFNGCIHPDLCRMMKDSRDSSYVRLDCCDEDYCNY